MIKDSIAKMIEKMEAKQETDMNKLLTGRPKEEIKLYPYPPGQQLTIGYGECYELLGLDLKDIKQRAGEYTEAPFPHVDFGEVGTVGGFIKATPSPAPVPKEITIAQVWEKACS